jgi:hypothetical protein
MVKLKKEVVENQTTNASQETIELSLPYVVNVKIKGCSDLLFHRWNCEEVETKSALAKGSKGKKTDNIESFVYRNEEGFICIPGEYLRMSIIAAAKFKQDPRSPRKSAMDLYKAALVCLTPLSSVGKKEWDYEDKRRVVVQRSGINRTRPALRAGWEAEFQIMVNLPEYVNPQDLNDSIATAGRLVGLADFRPTYGRFQIVNFQVISN